MTMADRLDEISADVSSGGRRARRYRFIDYATQIYLGGVGLLILLFHDESVSSWQLLVAAHGACMLAVHALILGYAARPKNRLLDFLRHFYPILLYAWLYRETGALNLMFVDHYLDRVFMQWDESIFGFQPSVRFMEALPYLPVSEVFYFFYFSYYIMIVGIGLALYLRRRERFFHYVSIISFVFYVCYVIYIFLPVVGSLIFHTRVPGFPGQDQIPFYPLAYPQAVESGPFFQIMKVVYHYFESHGAAFPSSHVAVAICTLYFSWRYFPRIRVAHLVAVVFLSLSTVYCRYHYAVDVPAGAATTAILLPLGNFLYRRFR